jgi:hypothetical protein
MLRGAAQVVLPATELLLGSRAFLREIRWDAPAVRPNAPVAYLAARAPIFAEGTPPAAIVFTPPTRTAASVDLGTHVQVVTEYLLGSVKALFKAIGIRKCVETPVCELRKCNGGKLVTFPKFATVASIYLRGGGAA